VKRIWKRVLGLEVSAPLSWLRKHVPPLAELEAREWPPPGGGRFVRVEHRELALELEWKN